jgi:hypothetical protein
MPVQIRQNVQLRSEKSAAKRPLFPAMPECGNAASTTLQHIRTRTSPCRPPRKLAVAARAPSNAGGGTCLSMRSTLLDYLVERVGPQAVSQGH